MAALSREKRSTLVDRGAIEEMLLLPLTISMMPPPARVSQPIALNPRNPHYFVFRGRPTVLISSGEHYGAVLNLDFDFVGYLDELKARGLNLTRTFSGAYRESPGNFNIARNTLAPKSDRFIAPWPRSATPGAEDGGAKFDLNRWDDAYFARLHRFLREADRHGVVVELVLFCPFYEDSMWNLSPMKATNNVNGVGNVPREEVYTLKHADLTAVQDALVRKLVAELRDQENLYYEICNEPYFGGVTLEWQRHISGVIAETEAGFPHRHLIAQNIANGSAKIENPDANVSIFNFHYASPPDAVAQNYGLNKAIAFDETGFKGTADATYRRQAWEFILAGGAVFDHLDYSFTAGHEDGTFAYPQTQPGGGSPALRSQLKVLSEFIRRFDFLDMRPGRGFVRGGVPEGGSVYALVGPGKAYAVYVHGGSRADLTLEVPAGRYRAEWVNTLTGRVDRAENVSHTSGLLRLSSPGYDEDVALRLTAR